MRRLVIGLDAFPALREATGSADVDVGAAAALARLAGADAVRLAMGDELGPVGEQDVFEARRAAGAFELRMPPSNDLLKVALQARPQRVVLAGEADVAVHSLKDLPTESTDGLCLAGVPERAPRRDALLLPQGQDLPSTLTELPAGLRIGTGSNFLFLVPSFLEKQDRGLNSRIG